ncbi:MAG: SGNH/GDSL hydrolase family protein [Planctomycetota bacterium]|jgi:lysophospholipase L1-like esterase
MSIPKPEGTLRILILGDSIAYGVAVSKNKTFSNRLEGLLRKQFRTAQVINAGVSGYTAYNELQYYLTKGREFEPDIVIVAFCMNDVVNPRLHWGYTKEKIVNIPDQAIPNHAYDQNHVSLRMQKLKLKKKRNFKERKKSLLEYSELYNALEWRVTRLFQKETTDFPNVRPEIPTYITGEDTLSIEVLLDESSPEWRWLTSIYSQLHNAVRADQATLTIALFPLAYQLDEDYPFLPQNTITEYCKHNSILCIDLLPSFRQHPKEDIFFLSNSQVYDIWHLTEYGHELCAEEILRFLQERKLLLREKKGE